MPSTGLGSIGLAFEPTTINPGEQVDNNGSPILTLQAVAATLSATNQPTGSTGMRCHVYVYGNTASGTVTIAGTDINGNSITETSPTIPIFDNTLQSNEVARNEYVTTNVYGTINSSGITTTGLTNGTFKIGGIPGAKSLAPGIAKIDGKYDMYSPDEHRAIGDRHTHKVQTIKSVDVELTTTLYPNSALWVPYGILSNTLSTSITTSPGSPTSLLSSTAVSGSPLSLTTQPTAPGMHLILALTGTSVAGNFVITGTDAAGEALVETVYGSGTNPTVYTVNRFASVGSGGIVVTGFTSGSVTVTGVYGWNRSWLPSITNPPYTNTLEWFTGSASWTVPGVAWSELDLKYDVKKELSVAMKGMGQDQLPIGSQLTTPMTASRVSALAQPVDTPVAGWQCNVYFDPLSGTPGTTQYAYLMDGGIKITYPLETVHTLYNKQVYTVLGRAKYDVAVDGKIVFVDVVQYEKFRSDVKQYLVFKFYGKNTGAGNIFEVDVTIPFKFTKFVETSTPTDKYPMGEFSGIGEYDPAIGASYKISWLNSGWNPSFTS